MSKSSNRLEFFNFGSKPIKIKSTQKIVIASDLIKKHKTQHQSLCVTEARHFYLRDNAFIVPRSSFILLLVNFLVSVVYLPNRCYPIAAYLARIWICDTAYLYLLFFLAVTVMSVLLWISVVGGLL